MKSRWPYMWTEDGQPTPYTVISGFMAPVIALYFLYLSFQPEHQEVFTPLRGIGLMVSAAAVSTAVMLWKLSNPYARWWMIHDHLWAAEADDPQSRKPIRKNFRIMAWILFIFAFIFNFICYRLSDLGYSL